MPPDLRFQGLSLPAVKSLLVTMLFVISQLNFS